MPQYLEHLNIAESGIRVCISLHTEEHFPHTEGVIFHEDEIRKRMVYFLKSSIKTAVLRGRQDGKVIFTLHYEVAVDGAATTPVDSDTLFDPVLNVPALWSVRKH